MGNFITVSELAEATILQAKKISPMRVVAQGTGLNVSVLWRSFNKKRELTVSELDALLKFLKNYEVENGKVV